jgi:hypothetical protein
VLVRDPCAGGALVQGECLMPSRHPGRHDYNV